MLECQSTDNFILIFFLYFDFFLKQGLNIRKKSLNILKNSIRIDQNANNHK